MAEIPDIEDYVGEEIPDDALTEIAEIAPDLTEQERKFVYWRSMALAPIEAFRRSGYSGGSWRPVAARPRVREALIALNERLEPQYRVTQQTVIGILMEAVDMARMKGQAKVLVEAATALGNVSGVTAAQKIQIDQRTMLADARVERKALAQLPRVRLEEMVGTQRVLPAPEVVEGEFEELP